MSQNSQALIHSRERSPQEELPLGIDVSRGRQAALRHIRFLQTPEVNAAEQLVGVMGGEEAIAQFRRWAYTYAARQKSEFYTMVLHKNLEDVLARVKRSKEPYLALQALFVILAHIEPNTGVVMLHYKDLATIIGCGPTAASRAMNALAKQEVLYRSRTSRKPVYHLNPNFAWNGKDIIRRREVEDAPQLGLSV